MCGIVCAFDLKQSSESLRPQLLEMSKKIRHRGPDWSGIYSDDKVIMTHERLAIVDPASGKQPLFSADKKLILAANGEVYNHRELREKLDGSYEFQTASDCEVILALYKEKGVDFIDEMNGMFGFAFAFTGLIILLLPSASAPSLLSGAVMVIAGISWGIYSLLGKKSASALLSTSGNFIYASLLCILMMGTVLLLNDEYLVLNKAGIYYALASGILASGCGYAIWYSVLPLIKSTSAATVQLSVPVIATMMGWTVLEEQLNLQIIIASLATLGGIYLVIKK